MPVTTPPAPTRPSADPDWARWEAELAERRGIDPGRPGPPEPPQPPSDDAEGRPGGDDGKPERIDFTWLKLLAVSFAVMATVGFVSTHQGANHRAPILSPVPPVAASKVAAQRDANAAKVDSATEHTRVVMNLPPSIPVR